MFSLNQLDKSFAAEITNIDLGKPLSDETFAVIHAAWMKHPVLVFRDQTFDVNGHEAFSQRFGRLKPRLRKTGQQGATAAENPNVMFVSNIKENGVLIGTSPSGALNFHSDSSFDEIPSKAGLLYGIEIPTIGGDTLFVDMCDVYNGLSDETKRFIADKWVTNIHLPSLPLDPTQTQEERIRTARKAVHPMVISHPDSGLPILYVNRHQTYKINGMSKEESDKILEKFFDLVDRPEIRYSHKWRKGDLVLWDNRRTQHGRSDFDPTQRRLLRRFAVFCDAPPKPFHVEKMANRPELEPA